MLSELTSAYKQKESVVGAEELRRFEKYVLLQVLDSHWKEHLAAMDYLRQSINLRAMAQKNPKQEYKREAFTLFSNLLDQIQQEVIKIVISNILSHRSTLYKIGVLFQIAFLSSKQKMKLKKLGFRNI